MTKMIHDYTAAGTIDAVADYLLIDPASSGVYKKISRNTLLGVTSAPLGLTDSQSPTNKVFDNTNSLTVKDGSLTIQNSAGTTKQAVFSAASITAGQTRTFTFPDASGTLATIAGTQTLTNKTLTSPAITGGTIDNSTITVDSISGHTSATIVTVANLQISNGVLNSSNAVTATSIADGAIQPKALVTGTGSGWAWSSWTPTYGNWTVGVGGTTVAKYIQVGKTVFYYLISTLGSSGFSVGTGVTFSLPVLAAASEGTFGVPIGQLNAVTSTFALGHVWIQDTSTAVLVVLSASGSYVVSTDITSTVPGTWVAGSAIRLSGSYEAA